eukprot:m.134225 g.134225  ORF g.134225 m.134225 type:complete len:102 (-) comp9532_c0_seq1:155-460(-)
MVCSSSFLKNPNSVVVYEKLKTCLLLSLLALGLGTDGSTLDFSLGSQLIEFILANTLNGAVEFLGAASAAAGNICGNSLLVLTAVQHSPCDFTWVFALVEK